MVIGIHISLAVYHDGYFDGSRLGFACLVADAVGIFWLILGFFLFNNTSYTKLLKKTAIHIGVPALLFNLFAFYFGEWIVEGVSLKESMLHSMHEYADVLRGFLRWNSPVKYGGHLWYINVYLLIIFVYPVLKATIQYLDEKIERQKTFLIITFAAFVVNDIVKNDLFQFSHHSINALFPAAIIAMWGHIIYKHKETLAAKKNIIGAVLVFIVLNIIRLFLQLHFYNVGAGDSLLFWYSSIGVVCASCVVIFSFCLKDVIAGKAIVQNAVSVLADHTFNIYLVHFFVIYILERLNFQEWLYHRTQFEWVYMILLICVVFSGSIMISVCLKRVRYLIQKKIKKS